jgi:hypothetical protein
MNVDFARDNLASTSLGHVLFPLNELGLSRSFCQCDNDGFLALEHFECPGVLGVDDDGDLIFERLSVGGEVECAHYRPSRTDSAIDKVKVRLRFGEVLFRDLGNQLAQIDRFSEDLRLRGKRIS